MHAGSERFWPRRLLWRFRGAWTWPAFAIFTIADGVLLHELPPQSTGIGLVPGLIIASFGNLFLIGLVAPWLARRLVARPTASPRERRVPPEVVHDRTATILLVCGTLGVIAAGLASRPAVITETNATQANAKAVRDYVLTRGSAEEKRNVQLGKADSIRLAKGYFRTCIPRDNSRLAFCYFVDTNRKPPTIKRDPSQVPNADSFVK
ncbi:MAG TPA: hypothetical protein VF752_16325 [Thermoleophilaceae bacterium]